MLTPIHDHRSYACPGEPDGVSRSVHLARLAAGYRKCAECLHRHETGVLPAQIVSADGDGDASKSAKRQANAMIRSDRGFRGVYLNELDRRQAISWAMALAATLWDENVVTLRSGVMPHDLSRRTGPTVVVGYDERPASPDILTGVILGLQRMSCTVIDVGLTTEPCLAFAVHHLRAEAGIYVTGAGCDPAQIGFDVRLRHGLPPDAVFLNRWEEMQRQPVVRRSRSSGSLRAFPATVPYEANLWKHFHALRPLHVACGMSSSQLLARLERLFARLPGRFTAVKLPVRRRDLRNPDDPDIVRIGNAVRDESTHFGIVIDDDAMAVGMLDERGQLVHSNRWGSLIVRHLLREHGPGKVILSADAWDEISPGVTAHRGEPVVSAVADCAARMTAEGALAALGTDGRIWLGGDAPACDAVVSLAIVMQALSLSDADLSQVLTSR